MTSELFDRLKKIVAREGRVVFLDNEDAYVLMPMADYEELAEDACGKECDCGCDSLEEEIFAESDKDDEADKELIKKVNKDIAKWRFDHPVFDPEAQTRRELTAEGREEQTVQEINKPVNQEIKIDGNPVNLSEIGASSDGERGSLTEEERYYLEPIE